MDKWNMIPTHCIYLDKVYRIVNIEMQGGYFTLANPEATKRGDTMILENIDMELCDPII
jgi:hypothetical protein